jgi:hypothetical protein
MTKLHYFIATLHYMDFIESIVAKEELTGQSVLATAINI